MRHLKRSAKLSRTTSHRRCMFANMLKALIEHGRIETTIPKAKELRRFADKMVTLAKKDTLAARRKAQGELMVRYNELSAKEAKAAKAGDLSAYNTDRRVINKLFSELGPRFQNRNGGYTRIMKMAERQVGDNTQLCVIEYLAD